MKTLTFFSYPSCTSCRKTKKWLRSNQVTFEERHIFRETPTPDELQEILKLTTEGLDELLATRSETFKSLNLDLDDLKLSDVLQLLSKEPKLLRRPIVTDGEKLIIGHHEDALKSMVHMKNELKLSM
ncbi:transcriptional regulator Spx [Actinomycetes bacterium NPDC127524]